MKDKCIQLKQLIFIILAVAWCQSKGQNLIPNHSFEKGECPYRFNRKPHEFRVDKWRMPDKGTPDYYHRCAKKEVSVPINWAGWQEPVSGNAYIGIYLKKGLYQENVGIKLKEKLVSGVKYHGRFAIASVANSEYSPSEISVAFTRDSLKFSSIKRSDKRQITIPFPHPDLYMDYSWQILAFTYIAKGGEKYFYVGSLHTDVTHWLFFPQTC